MNSWKLKVMDTVCGSYFSFLFIIYQTVYGTFIKKKTHKLAIEVILPIAYNGNSHCFNSTVWWH